MEHRKPPKPDEPFQSPSNLSKLPVLKRSGTYIVEAKNTPIKYTPVNIPTENETRNKTATLSKRPVLKLGEMPVTNTPNKTHRIPNPRSTSLSMLKQQKRAEINKNLNSSGSKLNEPVEMVANNKSMEAILKNARTTGALNLSNHELDEVPFKVWTINIDKLDNQANSKNATYSMDNQDSEEFRWWQQVELHKLILASNRIKVITRDVKNLQSLTILDIHDNQLETIDEAIGDLGLLQSLNLSHNSLKTIPQSICQLRHLNYLNLSFNRINLLPKNFGHLDDLEDLDLSNNLLSLIPKSFGWLTKLRKLNLATNSLKNLIPEIFFSPNVRFIDLSENQITELPKEIGDLENLEQLFLRQNKLKSIPVLSRCCKLKDWDISFNQIVEIDENCFDNLASLVNLNLRDNQLNSLTKKVRVLQTLERLDLSNNNLSTLPFELATIESLKQILLVGNPLRSIRKDIINRGTVAVIKYLRNHLDEPSDTSENFDDNLLRAEIVKSTKVFDLSCKKLTSITPNMISFCKQCTALSLNLSKNALQDLPNEMDILSDQLNELTLSNNLFSTCPLVIFTLTNLVNLDLRANQLTSVPNEITKLKSIRELIIADNKLSEIPFGVYELPIIETLFANNNQIKSIDAPRISKMKHLSTLNLQNNDIMQVPIELGKAVQLRSLQLEGNPFRLPRSQILAKGTAAILEYLRGRMVEQ